MAALGYDNGEIALFSLTKDVFLGELEAHESKIICADILETSSQSLFLLTVSVDKQARVHDLLLKEPRANLPEHLSKIVSAKFFNFPKKSSFVSAIRGIIKLTSGNPNQDRVMRSLDSSVLTLSSEGIVRCFDFHVPVLTSLFPTNKQNLQFLEIISIELTGTGSVCPVALISSGDEDLLLSEIQVASSSFGKISIFKRASFTKVIDLVLVGATHVLLLLENGQVEIVQVLNRATVVKKHKRKKQRKVQNLPELDDFLKQPSHYLLQVKTIKLDFRVKSLSVGPQRRRTETGSSGRDVYFFSSDNFYLRGQLTLSEGAPDIADVNKVCQFGHESAVRFVCLSSDDSMIFSGSKDACYLWESDNCSILKTIHLRNTSCAFFLPKNKFLMVGDLSGQIWLVDVATGTTLATTALIGNIVCNCRS